MNTERTEKFVNAIACDLEEGGFRQVSGTTLRRTLATAVSAALPLLEAGNPVSSPAGQGDDLLPCPFCGNNAEFVPYKNNGLTVKCKSMGCIQRHQRTLRYGIEWLRASMTEHWNARALAARQPGAQEAVAYWLAVDKDGVVEFGMSADDANGGQASRQEVNDFINGPLHEGGVPHRLVGVYAAPPAQGIDLGQVHAAVESLLEFADHHESCGDSDSYNNAELQTCGCGLDSAREQIWDALDGQRGAAPGVGNG